MWPVQQPGLDAGETFHTCCTNVRDRDLRRRFLAVRSDVERAANEYDQKANAAELHLIDTSNSVAGTVTRAEMIGLYDARMAKKSAAGRALYDQIKMLPRGDRCPFCDQRNVSTLDHLLPKTKYATLTVTPINLVGACMECNKKKLDRRPRRAEETFLHPYYDNIDTAEWLIADVIRSTPCAVVFRVNIPVGTSPVLASRMQFQFDHLELAALYSREAAREVSNIRHNLQTHFNAGGPNAVLDELLRQWRSRRANRTNSWQTATYKALSNDQWFYQGGFA
jgi:hypothetical protein